MRKNSIKNTRVNAEVQRELSTILRGPPGWTALHAAL